MHKTIIDYEISLYFPVSALTQSDARETATPYGSVSKTTTRCFPALEDTAKSGTIFRKN